MIPPIYLIILLSVFVFYCIAKMVRRNDDIHAMAFFVLYVYTIFAQIGYAYFPELSKAMGAYFGEELFYEYWLFMFLSFVFTYLFYLHFWRKRTHRIRYYVVPQKGRVRYRLFFLINFTLFIVLNLYFHSNRSEFGWGGSSPMGSNWFVIGFKLFTISTFILYLLVRKKARPRLIILLGVYFLFFIQVTFASGVRSDVLYLFIAIAFFELSPFIKALKTQKRRILNIAFIGTGVIWALFIVLALRTQTSNVGILSVFNYASQNQKSEVSTPERILMQDYYSPSHILFVSMYYKYIDPAETLKSNLANSIVLMKQPYLSQNVTALIGAGNERGVGWSYHFFVEGYNAVGWLGFLYNALMWNLGLLFWFTLLRSNNPYFNQGMQSILIFFITNTMRGQTCAFVQYYWMALIPGVILLALAMNSKIIIRKRR